MKIEAQCRKEGDGNESTKEQEQRKASSIALTSSGIRAQKRNKAVNDIQEPGTCRGHHQFLGAADY